MMKQQHKAMFIALRDGKFDPIIDGADAASQSTQTFPAAPPVSPAPGPPTDAAAARAPERKVIAVSASSTGLPRQAFPTAPVALVTEEEAPQTLRQASEELALDIDAVERAAAAAGANSPPLRGSADLPRRPRISSVKRRQPASTASHHRRAARLAQSDRDPPLRGPRPALRFRRRSRALRAALNASAATRPLAQPRSSVRRDRSRANRSSGRISSATSRSTRSSSATSPKTSTATRSRQKNASGTTFVARTRRTRAVGEGARASPQGTAAGVHRQEGDGGGDPHMTLTCVWYAGRARGLRSFFRWRPLLLLLLLPSSSRSRLLDVFSSRLLWFGFATFASRAVRRSPSDESEPQLAASPSLRRRRATRFGTEDIRSEPTIPMRRQAETFRRMGPANR